MICSASLACGDLLLQLLAIGLSNGAIIALNAIGVTLVYGAVRTINLAYGDLFALATVLITTTVARLGLVPTSPAPLLVGGLGLVLALAMLFGVGLNVAIERVAFRPFVGQSRQAPLLATIGLSFILFQAALIWRTAAEVGFGVAEHHSDINNLANVPHNGIADLLPQIDLVRAAGLPLNVSYTLKDLLVLVVAIALTVAVSWFLRRTRAGRALRACAQDPDAAELCGVNRTATIRLAFALGGLLAGAAAFVFALYYNRPFGQHGAESGLIAFAAAVLGGIGSPRGALWSGLLFGILAAFSDFFLAAQWTPVLVLAILILLLLLRPTGIAGDERDADEVEAPAAWAAAAQKSAAGRRQGWLTYALLALGLLYPLLDRALGLHQQSIITGMLIWALLALGLNLVLGFAGMLDLGYAAIFVVGGYAAAMLTDPWSRLGLLIHTRLDLSMVLLACMAVAGLFGALNGALTLRLRGDYLAIVTLASGQLIPRLLVNLNSWTGGAQGVAALPPPQLLTHVLRSPVERYYLVLALVALTALACTRLAGSRIGRAWVAMSADEAAARSCGVAPRNRLLAFVLGAMVAGLAGGLSATVFSYVDTAQSDFTVSATVLAMVVIGGAGSVRGAIVGALLVASYNQFVIRLVGGLLDWAMAATGGSLAGFDVRVLSYGSFGLALYLTVLLRTRGARLRVPRLPRRMNSAPGPTPMG